MHLQHPLRERCDKDSGMTLMDTKMTPLDRRKQRLQLGTLQERGTRQSESAYPPSEFPFRLRR